MNKLELCGQGVDDFVQAILETTRQTFSTTSKAVGRSLFAGQTVKDPPKRKLARTLHWTGTVNAKHTWAHSSQK